MGPVSALLTPVLAMTEVSKEANVAALIGTPALQQIVDKVDIYLQICTDKTFHF